MPAVSSTSALQDAVQWTFLTLPGNDNFSTSTNKYEVCRYSLEINFIGLLNVSGSGNIPYVGATINVPFTVTAKVSPDNWYVETTISGDDVNGASPSRFGISSFGVFDQSSHPRSVWSIAIDSSQLYPAT